MMSYELVAILDAPKASGMGMHGIILRDSVGLFTSGLKFNRRVNRREFDDLVDGGHVLPVDGGLPEELLGDLLGESGILWVGDEFVRLTSQREFHAPVPPRKGALGALEGRFWLDIPTALFATTQHWLKNALRQVVARGDPELAKLMLNVDVTSDYTRTALIHTNQNIVRDLGWFVRLDQDSGLPTTVQGLETRVRELVSDASSVDGLVVALVAHARQGSHETARDIAAETGVQFEAFRDYFVDEATRLFSAHDRRAMVTAGEIITDYRSPEAILEGAILERLRPSVRGVPSFVLDGLRHHHILEALRKVPTVKVELASITSPEEPVSTGIEESMSEVEIELSQTEQEVEGLVREASFELPRDRRRLDRALVAAA